MPATFILGRFAPSPSGRMHLGNLFAALLTWLDIRHLGGRLLLRIEDLDPDRCKPDYCSLLADDLTWLGLDWDLGWQPGDRTYCQSARQSRYEAAFHQLSRRGLVYPCFCTRRELLAASAPHASDGLRVYPGTCQKLSPSEQAAKAAVRSPAWRVRVPRETILFTDENYGPQSQQLDRDCGDFILRRSDGIYAYQLAVAEDDGAMGITRVTRGADLLSSTPRQLWLMGELGYTPPVYCHIPLLLGSGGRRLSKRDRDTDMGYLRAHFTPGQITGLLAYTAGLLEEPRAVTPQALIPRFSWKRVGTGDRPVDLSLLHTL